MNQSITAGRRPQLTDPILSHVAWRIALAAAARVTVGHLVAVLPDGETRTFGDAGAVPRAEIHIHDREAAIRLLVGGETGGGEAYMDGLWSSPDLAGLLRWAALNRESLALSTGWIRRPAQIRRTVAHRLRRNTRRQSRRNIAAHYDLGNGFYRTFLDETMTYSSAVFAAPDQSLADAQRNKYRLMAEGAGLIRGQHVLEIGTGWGGFALYAASSTTWLANASRPPGSNTWSTSSCATIATSPAPTTRSCRSRCSRPSGPSTSSASSRSAMPRSCLADG